MNGKPASKFSTLGDFLSQFIYSGERTVMLKGDYARLVKKHGKSKAHRILKALDHPVYQLTIRSEPGNWLLPVERRLARVLKTTLRAWGFRCVDVKELPTDQIKAK